MKRLDHCRRCAGAQLCLTLMAASGCTGAIEDAPGLVSDRHAALSTPDAQIKTEVLAPWVGQLAKTGGQNRLGFYGTDLGHVIKHRDTIRVIFGDGCIDRLCLPLGLTSDDSTASVSLRDFPDGSALERFFSEQTPADGTRTWANSKAPALTLPRNALGMVKPTELYRDGAQLDLGLLRAALTAFSNADDGLFILFDRNVALKCSSAVACPDGLSCDLHARSCASNAGELAACTENSDGCSCDQRSAPGLCVDRGTSVYADNAVGRFLSVAHQLDIAVEDPANPGTFRSQPWVTQRFVDSTSRAVNDFDPTRPGGVGNDYTTPTTFTAPTQQRVFLWGRANYLGVQSAGLDAKLYFAYVDMPRYEAQGHFAWKPQYFTGLRDDNVPQFSAREADAVPLDLSDGAGDTTEPNDVVFVGSVAYVPSLQRWVMFYGGGLLGIGLQHWAGAFASQVRPNVDGSIFARFAEQPWGPWSKPVTLFSPGDPTVASRQYGAGGILHHPGCLGADCAPSEPYIAPGEPGYLYAPYIEDPWTVGRGPGKADVYWNISSMAPYGILMMRSTIELPGQ